MSLLDRDHASRSPEGPDESRVPCEPGMWLFLLGDMTVFAMFFGAYLWEAGDHRAEFAADARALQLGIGLANVLVLLTSSYFVVRGVHAHRHGDGARTRRCLSYGLAGAGLFVGLKLFEYGLELSGGHGPTSSPFFMYYFVLTGLHLLHVLIGSVLLTRWRRSWQSTTAPSSTRFAEGAAGYWHMVDLLWILIFSFVYVGSHR